jgi:hypothetical protein
VLGVVSDLLDEVGGLLDDLLVTVLGPLGGVHLVDGDDELLNTKGVGKQGVLAGLAILGDTSLELTSTSGDDENRAIGLGGTGDHVLDEITVTGGVCSGLAEAQHMRRGEQHTNDGDVVLRCLELPQGNVDGDTTLALGLQFVEDPCVLEGTLTEFGGFL